MKCHITIIHVTLNFATRNPNPEEQIRLNLNFMPVKLPNELNVTDRSVTNEKLFSRAVESFNGGWIYLLTI